MSVSGNSMRLALGGVPVDAAAATMTQNRFNALMRAIAWAEEDWEFEISRHNAGLVDTLGSLREARAVIQKHFPLQAKAYAEEGQS